MFTVWFLAIRNSQVRNFARSSSGSQRPMARATAKKTSWSQLTCIRILEAAAASVSIQKRLVDFREFRPRLYIRDVGQSQDQAHSRVRNGIH